MINKAKTVYATLVTEADRVGLPKSYPNDLHVVDRKRLESVDSPACFGWVLRVCGTLLLDARMSDESRNDYKLHLTQSGRDSGDRFYWFGNSELHSVTVSDMFDRMSEHAREFSSLNRNQY